MTHEEIEAAIGRLRSMRIANRDFIVDVCRAFLDGEVTGDELHLTLIELLEQADPNTHIELPMDTYGEHIHIGDEMEYIADKQTFTVKRLEYCKKYGWYLGDACIEYPTSEYELYNPIHCRHHKPTVEDVLREFGDEVRRCCDTEDAVAEYAAKLREVMADECK